MFRSTRRVAEGVDALLQATAGTWWIGPRPTGSFVCSTRSTRTSVCATAFTVEATIARFRAGTSSRASDHEDTSRSGLSSDSDSVPHPYGPATGIELTENSISTDTQLDPPKPHDGLRNKNVPALAALVRVRPGPRSPRAERRADDGFSSSSPTTGSPRSITSAASLPTSAYVKHNNNLAFLNQR